MFVQGASPDLHSAISLPESESGATPCAVPAGPMTALSGQEAALASLSPRQAAERGLLTSGTCGPAFFHLISQCRPGTVFGEQVASRDGLAWFDLVQSDMETTGCAAVFCGGLVAYDWSP